ncbi:hypothetical protein JCM8547_003462 [Rhodosporidiobolus lusitaniae]
MPCDSLSLALSFTLPSLYASPLYSFKAPPIILADPLKSYYSLFVERALDKTCPTLLTPQQAVYLHRVLSSAAVVEEFSLDLPLLNPPRKNEHVSVELKSATVKQADIVIVEEMIAPPLVVVKGSSASTSSNDEDFLPSPPLSPTFSNSSSIPSPPPSPLFERDLSLPSENEQVEVKAKEPVVEVIRSSAYETKLAILDGWLDFIVQYTPFLSTSSAFSAARSHGLAFILSEENYELRYDSLHGTAQGPDEEDHVRAMRWDTRIQERMLDYVGVPVASFEKRPELYKVQPVSSRPCVQGISKTAVEAANSYLSTSASLDHYFSSSSTDLPLESLISLTSLRTALSRPLPRLNVRHNRSLHRDGDNAPLLHLVLYEEARKVEMARNAETVAAAARVLEGTNSTIMMNEEQEEYEGKVEIRLVSPPSPPSSSSSSSSASFSWSDEDEEDGDNFLASPPVFDDDEVKEGKKADEADLFSEAAPFSFYPPPLPSSVSSASCSNTESGNLCWADQVDEQDEDDFFASPPTWDD